MHPSANHPNQRKDKMPQPKPQVVTWLTRSMPADLRAALKMFAAYHKITAEEAANILLTEALQVRGKVEGVKYV